MTTPTTLLPLQPATMSTAQLAAVSFLARYSGRTHHLYQFQLREWFACCERNGLDPLVGAQRAHVELYIRSLGERGLMDSSVGVDDERGAGLLPVRAHRRPHPGGPGGVRAPAEGAARRVAHPRSGPLELIRFLQVAQTITVHHGALAYLLGINALRATEAAAVRMEDYADTLRGHRVLRLVGKGNRPATMPVTVPVLRVLQACRGERTDGPLILRPQTGSPIDRRDAYRMVTRTAKAAGIPRHISPHSLRHAAITNALDAGVPLRDAQILDRHAVHFLTAYVAGV